ncbi:MAG: hypothetical protein IKT14_00675 [Clostridiales bacterium]|nr:hypothetical protein [Clostridiales bacterium]
MPHASGGGSHGGGSHGGSHGGSSSRTSHHYFPGSRRYRRHYSNGTDEYFYSNGRPQKTSLSGIVVVAAMGVFFAFMMGITSVTSRPHQLKENYDRPSHYVYDDINVIGDDKKLERSLEEFNDLTGICPVIYTVYDSDCRDYRSLEDYTMHKYTGHFSDERHFVIVYTIPEEQAEKVAEDQDYIPDYAWEAVQGDDTDPILSDAVFMDFADYVQEELEDGKDPGEAFAGGFDEVLTPKAEKRMSTSSFSILTMIQVLFTLGFFGIPLFFMVRQYKKDKDTIIEEVPLTEEDVKNGASLGSATINSRSATLGREAGPLVGTALVTIFLVPFVLIGIGVTIGGAVTLTSSKEVGIFLLGFGIIWTAISVLSLVGIIKGILSAAKKKEAPLTAEYPASKPVTADYPAMEKQDIDPYGDFDMPQTSTSYTREEDEEYERMRRKGYE